MARVTVEDCVEKVPNRFELVLLASHRSRDLSSGAPLSIDRDNDRNPVVALREIADETIAIDGLRDALIRGLQKHVELDEPEEDMLELMSSEELLGAAGMLTGESDEAPAAHAAADAESGEATDDSGETPEDAAETPDAAAETPEDAAETPEDAAETPDADQATEKE